MLYFLQKGSNMFYLQFNSFLLFIQDFFIKIIRQGPLPNHIGIIMDGNRRFAKMKKLSSPSCGHEEGGNKMLQVIDIITAVGIREMTLFAFSVDNFKRSKEEVDGLMNLFYDKITYDFHTVYENGGVVEFIGDFKKAPVKLRNAMANAMLRTKDSHKFKLNIAFAYGGQREIANGLNILLNGLTSDDITIDDADKKLLEESFTLKSASPVNVLIRTGGDHRMSDFLLWQSGKAYIHFFDNLTWPEIRYWHLLKAIIKYQISALRRDFSNFIKRKRSKMTKSELIEKTERQRIFLQNHRKSRWADIVDVANRCKPKLPGVQESAKVKF